MEFHSSAESFPACPRLSPLGAGLTMKTRTTSDVDVRVQPLVPSDLDDVLAIERASFAAPWNRVTFNCELLRNPFGRLYGALLNRPTGPGARLLGYVCYWVVFDELRLMNLAVHPDHRRHGVARRLIRYALEDGLDQGTTRALLEVRVSNTAARRFYHVLGFQQYGQRTAYYTNPSEDAILMQLTDWNPEDF